MGNPVAFVILSYFGTSQNTVVFLSLGAQIPGFKFCSATYPLHDVMQVTSPVRFFIFTLILTYKVGLIIVLYYWVAWNIFKKMFFGKALSTWGRHSKNSKYFLRTFLHWLPRHGSSASWTTPDMPLSSTHETLAMIPRFYLWFSILLILYNLLCDSCPCSQWLSIHGYLVNLYL